MSEYTFRKKESGNNIVRLMCAPFDLWDKMYKEKFTKRSTWLVIVYKKSNDELVPRKQKDNNRGKFLRCWKKHWWFGNYEKAINKYNKL